MFIEDHLLYSKTLVLGFGDAEMYKIDEVLASLNLYHHTKKYIIWFQLVKLVMMKNALE